MQREKLVQAMARRNQRKDQEHDPAAQVTFSSMSVDDTQQAQASFAANYLDSHQLTTTADIKQSSAIFTGSKIGSGYEPQGKSESFHKLDRNLADLQSQFESYVSVSPKRKINSDQRVAQSRAMQGSELSTSTSRVSLDDQGTFEEQTSYISLPGDSAPDVQYKPSPPKEIPRPQPTNMKQLQQQVRQQEQLIQQYQKECDRLTTALRELQQNVPVDDREQKVLIQKMRTELINAREVLQKQDTEHQAVVHELTQQLETYEAQQKDHTEIIGTVNRIVTGQNDTFDFESLVALLKSKFSTSQSQKDDGPGADYYVKRLREATEDMRSMREVVQQKESELLKLQCKYNALELQLQTQQRQLSQPKPPVAAKGSAPQPAAFQHSLQQKDAEIQRLKQEIADLRAYAVNSDPAATQDIFRDQLRQAQQAVQSMTARQQAQEEEYQRRLQAFADNEQSTLAKVRDAYETRLKDLQIKTEDLEVKRRQAEDLASAWQRRFDKLNQQYEQDQISGLQKRIDSLEQQPPSLALKEVMERVVKAENQLSEERRHFQLVCKEKTVEIAEYKAQLMEILNAIAQLGV